ncbi:MAG: hypothetical protein MK226_13690 [Saprospiraceae bacterium]|nr:hypothetical protein [Saprospiraceae bacterium]
MKIKEQIVTINRLHDLIRRKQTGTPQQLAGRLNISNAKLFRYLAFLKEDFEAPICYCKSSGHYYYEASNFEPNFRKITVV